MDDTVKKSMSNTIILYKQVFQIQKNSLDDLCAKINKFALTEHDNETMRLTLEKRKGVRLSSHLIRGRNKFFKNLIRHLDATKLFCKILHQLVEKDFERQTTTYSQEKNI